MAKEKENKTNAMRILDRLKIEYTVNTYECGEFIDGVHIADMLGQSYDSSFKTLVLVGKSKAYYVFVLPIDKELDMEWARIPHFYYNYYVYQYATGFSAAIALSQRILSEGESAVADYKKFLSSGGSSDPISLLKIAGVDMSTPDPVNSALQLFGELVDEMEKLV